MPAPAPSRFADTLRGISSEQTVLIAGPTASGKSALALEIAAQQGGVIVNADASQVYDCWRVLTARPSVAEEAQARHALYGHVGAHATYSTGHWLRETTELLQGQARLIIVGGTGLYFSALTRGLAHIPEVPRDVRATADTMTIEALLDGVDSATRALIDPFNRARVQRAWEVWTTTGRGLSDWQNETADPVLDPKDSFTIVFDVEKDWLNARIEKRFDQMLAQGVLDEVRAVEPEFDPSLPAHRAIGAPELVAHLRGEIPLDGAREAIIIATRQFAKRQRTWLRSKMADWHPVHPG